VEAALAYLRHYLGSGLDGLRKIIKKHSWPSAQFLYIAINWQID
jgi:hypothetical protein